MKTTESTWHKAKIKDRLLSEPIFGYGKSNVFLTIEELQRALNKHMIRCGEMEYYICTNTYRKTYDDNGDFVKSETICEVIDTYPKGD